MKNMKELRKRSISLLLILSMCITFFSPACVGEVKAAEVGEEPKAYSIVLKDADGKDIKSEMTEGETLILAPVLKNGNQDVEGAKFEYSTSDDKIATVDEKGLLTAVKVGTTDITVKGIDSADETKSAEKTFTLTVIPKVESITIKEKIKL